MSLQTVYPSCPLALEEIRRPSERLFCNIVYSRDAWVKLLQPLSSGSFDEAMLLCQDSPETWVAWVPDYGEVILDRSQFYC
jgi:hypothetical protein